MLQSSVRSGTCTITSSEFLLAVTKLTSWWLASWGAQKLAMLQQITKSVTGNIYFSVFQEAAAMYSHLISIIYVMSNLHCSCFVRYSLKPLLCYAVMHKTTLL